VAVCRELTKIYEEVVSDTALALASRYAMPPKGEVTLVIGPTTRAANAEAAVAAVVELVAAGSQRSVAAAVVARLTGVSRNALYKRSL
jgi:16S rRNA (cytidine1402-2'-O)-methyltransferase